MKENYPDFLYHYTSIENLALILKNKTIRFNSLINVDDITEIKTLDTEGIGKYCYCSCWTDKEESIPFWNMYTNDMHGVMIKLPPFPFNSHEEYVSYYAGGKRVNTYIPKEIFDMNNAYVNVAIPFLRKVQYVENPQVKFFSKKTRNDDGTFDFKSESLGIGLNKSLDWEFQSEWRYSIMLFPHDKSGKLMLDVSDTCDGLIQKYYDVKLSEKAINSIEITMGPKTSVGEKILIETICEKFLPSLKLSNSKLKIR